MMLNRKCVALVSGGLDSIVAVKLALEQNLEIYGLKFYTPFCKCKFCLFGSVWKILNIPLKLMTFGQEYIELVRNPKHGYGSQMNPCIDCRIFFFSQAKRYMEEIGASFIITGEVLDERPMSQKLGQLKIIETESGLEGLILRPLSAKKLPPSKPEIDGIVDREKLLDIQGRSRKRQIELAYLWGIYEFPSPAGGCLLTDPQFAKRISDLFKHSNSVSVDDIELLKIGRHFRIDSSSKLIIPRDDNENLKMQSLISDTDYVLSYNNSQLIGLYRGDGGNFEIAASIYLRYLGKKVGRQELEIKNKKDESVIKILSSPIDGLRLNNFRINK